MFWKCCCVVGMTTLFWFWVQNEKLWASSNAAKKKMSGKRQERGCSSISSMLSGNPSSTKTRLVRCFDSILLILVPVTTTNFIHFDD